MISNHTCFTFVNNIHSNGEETLLISEIERKKAKEYIDAYTKYLFFPPLLYILHWRNSIVPHIPIHRLTPKPNTMECQYYCQHYIMYIGFTVFPFLDFNRRLRNSCARTYKVPVYYIMVSFISFVRFKKSNCAKFAPSNQ